MIHTEYVDEYELQYQVWHAKHHPWFARLSASKADLDESCWRYIRSYPLAIDHEFHVAHCILTLKRYWKARESNHDVCQRDVSHNHINYRIGVLESYAFNVKNIFFTKNLGFNCTQLLTQSLLLDFETMHRMESQINGASLMWIVNACF
jgi:hypothetical protein